MDPEFPPDPSGIEAQSLVSPKTDTGSAHETFMTPIRVPKDPIAPLPLAIDALDATIELYTALDPDTPGCCIPNELLSKGLHTIAGKLTSIIVAYIDLEHICQALMPSNNKPSASDATQSPSAP